LVLLRTTNYTTILKNDLQDFAVCFLTNNGKNPIFEQKNALFGTFLTKKTIF